MSRVCQRPLPASPAALSTVRSVPHVLEGMRVVDVTTGPVGGMATMVLADFGADVIKVEPPGGDRFRATAAAPLWLRGKRSVTADLATEHGRADLQRLVQGADVVVVSGPPSRARRWGIDADAALATRPDLVHCSITGWGPVGPLAEVPGWDAAVAARSGRMLAFERQLRRGGPVFAAVPVAAHVAAHGAVQGIVAGLFARARGAGAQRVETSLLQGVLPFDLVELLLVEMFERSGTEVPNITTVGGDMPTLNYHPVRTKDGRWIQCGNLLEHLLLAFLDATDLLGELLVEERFATPPGQWDEATVDAARDRILVRMQERTAAEWMETFRANGNVAAEEYLTTTEALDHPDLVGNGDIVTLDDPVHGPVRTIGPIAELRATPAVVDRPAPVAGAHTAEVLGEHRDPVSVPVATPTVARVAARRRHGRRVRHDHRRAARHVDARRSRRPRHQGRVDRRRPLPPPRRRRDARRQDHGRQDLDLHRPEAGRRASHRPGAGGDGRRRRAQRAARGPGPPRPRRGAAARSAARADLGLADRLRAARTWRRPTGDPSVRGRGHGRCRVPVGRRGDGVVRDARRRP